MFMVLICFFIVQHHSKQTYLVIPGWFYPFLGIVRVSYFLSSLHPYRSFLDIVAHLVKRLGRQI